MTTESRTLIRNFVVVVVLWLCFSFLGALVAMAWSQAVVAGRPVMGPGAGLVISLASSPAYLVCGTLVGLGVSRLIKSDRVVWWAATLGLVCGVADLASFGGIQHRGADVLDMALRFVAIVGGVPLGCWIGVRRLSGQRSAAA